MADKKEQCGSDKDIELINISSSSDEEIDENSILSSGSTSDGASSSSSEDKTRAKLLALILQSEINRSRIARDIVVYKSESSDTEVDEPPAKRRRHNFDPDVPVVIKGKDSSVLEGNLPINESTKEQEVSTQTSHND